jgi:hypothetical protein
VARKKLTKLKLLGSPTWVVCHVRPTVLYFDPFALLLCLFYFCFSPLSDLVPSFSDISIIQTGSHILGA